VIEFRMDGTVITANSNFLSAMGYSLEEVQNRHHGMFVDEATRQSVEYRDFWAKLNRGEHDRAEYRRIGKGGKEVWIQASYNPILDLSGRPVKVIKYATDITRQKLSDADFWGQIIAINQSQAVIHFELDGTIVTANDNFLHTLGYKLDEIKGRHHSMFVEEDARQSAGYREFWAKLNRGEFQQGQYKRMAKGGNEVWIQASYNPIRDLNGRLSKVVKYASDITAEVKAKHELAEKAEQAAQREKAATEDLKHKVDSILVVVNAAAKGDLRQEISVAGSDAIGQMGEGLTQFFSNLRESVSDIGKTAIALGSSSEELTAVSQQMSANSEETSTQANVVSAASQQSQYKRADCCYRYRRDECQHPGDC
jgi:methyl-accepting chemotaxis protein